MEYEKDWWGGWMGQRQLRGRSAARAAAAFSPSRALPIKQTVTRVAVPDWANLATRVPSSHRSYPLSKPRDL